RLMPTWGATIWGVVASGVLAVLAAWFLVRDRRPAVLATTAAAAMLGPLLWDLILRHTGGDFFVDAPGYVFPVSFEDAGSGVFATGKARALLPEHEESGGARGGRDLQLSEAGPSHVVQLLRVRVGRRADRAESGDRHRGSQGHRASARARRSHALQRLRHHSR